MSIARFHDFSSEFCAIAGVPVPELVADEHGALAFSVEIRGIPVTAILFGHALDFFHLIVELGPVPQDISEPGWSALMTLNLYMLADEGPAFSRDPESGHAVLQRRCELGRHTPEATAELALQLAAIASDWQAGRLAPDQVQETGTANPGGSLVAAR